MKKIAIAAVLAMYAISASAATELVVNGDFETGDFTGWTQSGNRSQSQVTASGSTSNHTYVWRSGATGTSAYISQQIATTVGGLYTLSFDVYNRSTRDAVFEANFNGVQVAGFSNEVHDWTHFTFTNLQASSVLTELKFGARSDPNFIRLDNISVTAVPEPETYAMLLAGLGMLGWMARRRQA